MAPSEILSAKEATRQLPLDSTLHKVEPDSSNKNRTSEEIKWAHHHHNGENDSRLHSKTVQNEHSAESQQERKLRQRLPRSRNISSNDNNSSGTSITRIPQVKYAKGGILLSPPNVIIDRRGDGAEEVSHVLPGETLYLSPTTNKATGQYQLQSSFSNGMNNDGNGFNNYNSNAIMNGGPPQPHPYNNNNGVIGHPPYPPFISYPHPGAYPNFYDPNGQYVITSNTTSNGLNVRGEEVGIVLVVLLLWVGAIILFFNRWGKIRMLEPYQPKFCENHRPSCPMAEVNAISSTHPVCRERTFSKFNLSTEMLAGPNGSPHFVKCNYHGIPSADPAPGFSGFTTAVPGGLTIPGAGFPSGGSTGMLNSHRNSIMMMNHHHHHSRPRQNSVFVTSPSSQVSFYGSDTTLKNSSRKTKSAVDLPTLVLTGEFIDNVRRNSKNSITQL